MKLYPVPEGLRVRYLHLRDPEELAINSRGYEGDLPPRWVTIAELWNGNTKITEAAAFCHPNDNPSRRIGRTIAHNRVIEEYRNCNDRG